MMASLFWAAGFGLWLADTCAPWSILPPSAEAPADRGSGFHRIQEEEKKPERLAGQGARLRGEGARSPEKALLRTRIQVDIDNLVESE